MANRPDFSNLLAHFSSDRIPVGKNHKGTGVSNFSNLSAFEKMISILESRKIYSSKMPWTNSKAVCFTECPWTSLIVHIKNYSSYGIGFNKSLIFSRNGSPVFYVRADQYQKQEWNNHIKPFVTPFWPNYRPKSINAKKEFPTCDYTHEREWRIPHDFDFDYKHIEFIILDNYSEIERIPKDILKKISNDKIILMENYKKIERLWPVHKLDL